MVSLPSNVTIVVPFGFKGAGKGYVYETLQQELEKTVMGSHRLVKLAFADLLKDCVALLFGWDRELLSGATPESRTWREGVDPYWDERLRPSWGQPITPRYVLQRMGTEVVRQHIHPDFWVLALDRQLQRLIREADQFTATWIVVDDCRFENEAALLQHYDRVKFLFMIRETPSWAPDHDLESFVSDLRQHPSVWQQIARAAGEHQSEWDWFSFFATIPDIHDIWNVEGRSVWDQIVPLLT